MIRERVHDTYRSDGKPPEPTVCPECGAVFRAGRWTWAAMPMAARAELCPACRRTRDRCPAGWVRIEGDFFDAHKHDLLRLIEHVEAMEKGEHPLNRIMDIERSADEVIITTTNLHLARAIGDALHSAHEGELDYQYEPESPNLIVRWRR